MLRFPKVGLLSPSNLATSPSAKMPSAPTPQATVATVSQTFTAPWFRNVLLTCLVLPFLNGCITGQNPLSTEKFTDDAVVGHWHSEENPQNIVDLDITHPAGGDYHVVQTESNLGKPQISSWDAFITHGKRANYVNMIMPKKDGTPAYLFLEYSIRDNQLHVHANKFVQLKEEMQAKKLNGSFDETTWGENMNIAEPAAKLLALFDAADGEKYFGEEMIYNRTADNTSAEINSVLKLQADAWNAGDLTKFMTAYLKSPSITFVSSDGELRGYDALQARYEKRYGTSRESMGTLSFADLQATPLGNSHAMCVGHWHVEQPKKPELHGLFTLVLEKTGDGWKIIHDHTSSFPVVEKK